MPNATASPPTRTTYAEFVTATPSMCFFANICRASTCTPGRLLRTSPPCSVWCSKHTREVACMHPGMAKKMLCRAGRARLVGKSACRQHSLLHTGSTLRCHDSECWCYTTPITPVGTWAHPPELAVDGQLTEVAVPVPAQGGGAADVRHERLFGAAGRISRRCRSAR